MTPIEIGAILTTVITSQIESFIDKKIDKLKISKQRKLEIATNVANYSHRTYKKLYFLKTIIHQDNSIPLLDLYHPLKVTKLGSKKTTEINSNCIFFLDKYDKILITDYAGMGKSTISKFMYLTLREKGDKLPIFIELRRIKSDKSLFDLLKEDFGDISAPLSTQSLSDILDLSDIIIFFDGFDEISLDARETAIRDIIDFTVRYPDLKYVITSRSDSELSNFVEFKKFTIKPLDRDDVESLLKRYDTQGNLSGEIIKELRRIDDESFHEILQVPMMVTLLFRSFGYSGELPSKKYQFYKQVYEALYNGHDLTKEGFRRNKSSNLDIDEFQNVLRSIAFQSAKSGPSYSRDDLVNKINKAFEKFGYTRARPAAFISDLLQSVPLFSDENVEIRWIHKSLQDYFAASYAVFIISDNQKKTFEKMFHSDKSFFYANIIELSYDMKPHIIEEVIILPYLIDYLIYSDNCGHNNLHKSVSDRLYQRVYMKFDITNFNHSDKDRFKQSITANMHRIKAEIGEVEPRIRRQAIYSSSTTTHFLIAERPKRWILDFISKKYKGIFINIPNENKETSPFRRSSADICVGHASALRGEKECAKAIEEVVRAFSNRGEDILTISAFEIDNQRVKEITIAIQLKIDSMNAEEEF
ncbi:NACHT domain-containing protein [Deinococcus humi]|uniref:NACHT domain-containing protein n=1 Tax=Deinococcus humi TaxID=662880 RepID=A0A7W8JRV7_9DEIO|nr:NACHT domain-containing protein [Deinococcus humi]MBB5362046.1 hypothetical protein [Deinococcus humi]GGO22332.1 hypothetical protein GCM10008949_09490 [Deinococcus humi]